MNSLLRSPIAWIALLLIAPLLVSCTPDATAEIISPQLGAVKVAQASGGDIILEPTAEPPKMADLTPEDIFANVPAELASAIESADPAGGPTVALVNACSGCHAVEPGAESTGPTWVGLRDRAVANAIIAGNAGPVDYIHESIIDPVAYGVPGYDTSLMPKNFAETISQEDMATLIAYILSIDGGE